MLTYVRLGSMRHFVLVRAADTGGVLSKHALILNSLFVLLTPKYVLLKTEKIQMETQHTYKSYLSLIAYVWVIRVLDWYLFDFYTENGSQNKHLSVSLRPFYGHHHM